MDPVGPWSAYASYNRLAGVQAGASSGDLHHHLSAGAAAGSPATTTTQILPGGFLSPPPVGYETVFSPLFHPATAKPAAHYVNQHRQALAQASASKQTPEGEYHQAQAFFEQGASAWQQNSPFGILPHESVVATTSTKTTPYENFNAHFAAQSLNHLNTQLAVASAKNALARAQSPQATAATKTPTSQSNSGTFFQVPTTFPSDSSNNTKSFSAANSVSLQQSCIVTSPSNTPVTKDYRVPQASSRSVFLTASPSRSAEKSFVTPVKQSQPPQIQTKAQTKIYPELGNQSERQRSTEDSQSQSSPISFSMDAAGRLNYPANSTSNKRSQFQHSNYRHYQQGSNSEPDFQRPKSGSDYNNTNGPDCNVVVPRKPSPLQAHSQASPIGHAPSPAYPMYNSPMNSISSPQQNSSNQVTPSSPLDVSVPRPNSQTGNVAYPSVITRALNSEKNFNERYERTPQQNQNNQNCWDERQSQARKFQTHSNTSVNNYNSGTIEISSRQIELANRTEPSLQRTNTVNVSDRQQTYFDSGHQVSLQDLSSCRGDPMSIVKNLQQQQTCQIQQVEIKQEEKCTVKRRKSNDKSTTSLNDQVSGTRMDYFPGPIPPPAHSSAASQQQQNGGYFEFDRWNLPTSASKIFSSQTIHQQHQGLMVPHPHPHHPPPPLPYFPPFHLPPHPADFPASVEITPISTYNEQSAQPTSSQFPPQEDQPKVVVPNIEEELNFLSEGTVTKPSNSSMPRTNPIVNKSSEKPSGPGAGFMNSYLKFLQGERDSSPPPPARGGRKQSWNRSKTIQSDAKPDSNGVNANTTPVPVTRLSQGDPQDDPRYFPLPKERKKNSFDSSDDGFSSDDDFFNKKNPPIVKPEPPPKEKPARKGRPPKPGGPSERKRVKQALLQQQQDQQILSEPTPRRESSKRAAKEKSNIKQLIAKDDEAEEPAEFMDSDSDPAWTPQAKEEPEEEVVKVSVKKGKRGRPAGRKKVVRNPVSPGDESAPELDSYSNDAVEPKTSKRQRATGKRENQKVSNVQAPENNAASQLAPQKNTTNIPEDNLFKPGEFVVIKSELEEEWPAIWRVDGKTLLQKYEPFEQNGQTLYRNISTYTSWTPESKKQYVTVPVKYRSQSHLETVVEFLKSEMTVVDQEFFDKVMKENEVYQDNFEVYIQTLISQALDSNFLTEIFQEQDDYFLSNVKTIDEITNSKKQKLLSLLRWPHPVQVAVSTWPCFNIIRELSSSDAQNKSCAACLLPGVSVRVLMYGQPYNSTTLEGCQPDPFSISEKDFLMCRICANRVQLFNKITHQKYLMYIECAKRVAEKRTTDPHKDTTCILNELLADENWLNQLFLEVRSSWGEVDSLNYNYKIRNSKI